MIYNAVFVTMLCITKRFIYTYIYIYILFHILFHSGLSQVVNIVPCAIL